MVLSPARRTRRPTYFVDAEVRLLPGARPLRARRARARAPRHARHPRARRRRSSPDGCEPGQAGARAAAARAAAGRRRRRPVRAAPGRAARHARRRARSSTRRPRKHGPERRTSRRLRALQSGDPLEALRLELEAAPLGRRPRGGRGLLAQLARSRDAAVRAGRARRRWFTPAALERARRDVLRAVAASEPGRGVGAGALARMAALEVPAVVGGARGPRSRRVPSREHNGVFTARAAPRALDDPLAAPAGRAGARGRRARRARRTRWPHAAGVDRAVGACGRSTRLAAEGVLVRLRPGVYFDPAALSGRARAVVAACERDGAVTIARAARLARHQPQARAGDPRAPRRDPGHAPPRGRARACGPAQI